MNSHRPKVLDETLVRSEMEPYEIWVGYINDRRERLGSSLVTSLKSLNFDLATGNVHSRSTDPEYGHRILSVAKIVEGGHITDTNLSDDFEESEDCAMVLAVGDFLAERGVIDPLPETRKAIND